MKKKERRKQRKFEKEYREYQERSRYWTAPTHTILAQLIENEKQQEKYIKEMTESDERYDSSTIQLDSSCELTPCLIQFS